MAAQEAVITGLGAVSPHGRGVKALWSGLLEGRSAFAPLSLFDASMFRNPLAGIVAGYEAPKGAEPARALRMLEDAAEEALQDAFPGFGGHDPDSCGIGSCPPKPAHAGPQESGSCPKNPLRIAIVAGTNFGGMSAAESALTAGGFWGHDPIPQESGSCPQKPAQAGLDGYLFGLAGTRLAQRFGLRGPRYNLSLSCASGTAAIGIALDLVRLGRAEVVLACGYDELSLFAYAGLSALRAITPETIRPFDKRRKGTLFSEGAGVVVVESAAHAARRKAPRIYARLLGRAMNNDAYHMTAPEQEGRGIQALLRAALADAQIAPEAVEHFNLHATGTPYNDAIETKALLAVFGERARLVPVCAVKSSIGHCLGAAGSLETIAAVMTLCTGKIPPILGLDPAQKDPECNLCTPTGAPLAGEFKTILKTSYGFGGTNAALILGRLI
jgi:3-oxoacyl-[acyl-carrier-protein] synthase II